MDIKDYFELLQDQLRSQQGEAVAQRNEIQKAHLEIAVLKEKLTLQLNSAAESKKSSTTVIVCIVGSFTSVVCSLIALLK